MSGALKFGSNFAALPLLLTVEEAADLLRTTPKAIYSLHARRRLQGARRFGKRLLIHRDELLGSLTEVGALSLRSEKR